MSCWCSGLRLKWGTCRLNGTVPEMNEQLGPAVLEGVVSTYRLLVDVVAFYLVISGLYIANSESNDLKVLFYEDKSSKMCTFMYSTEWTCRLFLETWPLTRWMDAQLQQISHVITAVQWYMRVISFIFCRPTDNRCAWSQDVSNSFSASGPVLISSIKHLHANW